MAKRAQGEMSEHAVLLAKAKLLVTRPELKRKMDEADAKASLSMHKVLEAERRMARQRAHLLYVG